MQGIRVVLVLLYLKTCMSDSDLHRQNENEYLNPINDQEQDHRENNQDKRTIFSNHHGWAKHIGVHPSGFKYIIGYGPVDLKYVPVVKPISIRPYHNSYHHNHHHRFKVHLKPVVVKPLLPVRPVLHNAGWKPVVPIIKPVVPIKPIVPVVKPESVHTFVSHNPWKEEIWTKPVHSHVVETKPAHIHPIVSVPKPVIDHLHHHVPIIKPIHHVPIKPIIPSKPLISVNQPGLPLVPVAAPLKPLHSAISTSFNWPIHTNIIGPHNHELLHQHYHHQHQLVPVSPLPILPVSPVVPQSVAPVHFHSPHVYPQLPHVHPHHHLHSHIHPDHVHPHILHPSHQAQSPLISHEHHSVGQHLENPNLHIYENPEFHHNLPHVHQIPANNPEILHHQLSHDPHIFHENPQVPIEHQPHQSPPVLFHQDLPGNVQHHFNQHIHHGDGASSNILLEGSIRPGHTDVQIPVHLPQHPNFLPSHEGGHFHDGHAHAH